MPDGTPELRMLRRVWGTDALMYFSHAQGDWIPHSTGNCELHYATSGLRISSLSEKSENAEKYDRCGELHIQEHLKWQMFCPEFVALGDMRLYSTVGQGSTTKVVLELDGMAGWRSQLETAKGRFSSEFKNPHLEVTIVAPPVGTLGTFRRSPVTRLWFSGSHEAHLLGQKEPTKIHARKSNSAAEALHAPSVKGYKNAAVFWLASELCRRQPGYVLHNYWEPVFGDGLRLLNTTGPISLISRDGGIWTEGIKAADAVEIYISDNKRALLADLEKKLGIPVRDKSAPTTVRTVVYRAMAHILGLAVGKIAQWDFVAVDELADGSIWQLVRDGKTTATLMPNGDVLQASGTTNMMHRYKAHSRRLTAMVGEVFGSTLP
ncbi:hypothetical protein [Arthrobacter sp. NPDC056727]|uniref:TY-Chap2 family putative peptide chaperone n=1 Tax=Arthrobacter sp. NPDC056727 TaxID=3345927 RepID=UPI00366EA0B2